MGKCNCRRWGNVVDVEQVKEVAAPLSQFPVEITAVHVGPCASKQREMISIDISEYGDPLHTRMMRMPFTNYLKPWVHGLAHSLGIDGQIPTFRCIPLHEMDIRQAIKVRQVDADVIDLARRASVSIPEQIEGTTRLLKTTSPPICGSFTNVSTPTGMMPKIAGMRRMTAHRRMCFRCVRGTSSPGRTTSC